MKEAQATPSENPGKSKAGEELAREPQIPPLKLGILVFMFLCEDLSPHLGFALSGDMSR